MKQMGAVVQPEMITPSAAWMLDSNRQFPVGTTSPWPSVVNVTIEKQTAVAKAGSTTIPGWSRWTRAQTPASMMMARNIQAVSAENTPA